MEKSHGSTLLPSQEVYHKRSGNSSGLMCDCMDPRKCWSKFRQVSAQLNAKVSTYIYIPLGT